jgi:hypothetical protein
MLVEITLDVLFDLLLLIHDAKFREPGRAASQK